MRRPQVPRAPTTFRRQPRTYAGDQRTVSQGGRSDQQPVRRTRRPPAASTARLSGRCFQRGFWLSRFPPPRRTSTRQRAGTRAVIAGVAASTPPARQRSQPAGASARPLTSRMLRFQPLSCAGRDAEVGNRARPRTPGGNTGREPVPVEPGRRSTGCGVPGCWPRPSAWGYRALVSGVSPWLRRNVVGRHEPCDADYRSGGRPGIGPDRSIVHRAPTGISPTSPATTR